MGSQHQHYHSGIGFAPLLAITFIVLKLTGVISWPWIWVLSPIWIFLALVLVFFVIGVLVLAAYDLLKK